MIMNRAVSATNRYLMAIDPFEALQVMAAVGNNGRALCRQVCDRTRRIEEPPGAPWRGVARRCVQFTAAAREAVPQCRLDLEMLDGLLDGRLLVCGLDVAEQDGRRW
jgi:hypothetical protein